MPPAKKDKPEIPAQKKLAAESQIRDLLKEVDYQTKEFTVELLVQKYVDGREDDENEIYIPAYQRGFVWSQDRQSKFIESVILGLPVPYIFIATLPKDIGEDEGRAEIVDGSQRIRTLASFVAKTLSLSGLERLTELNGFQFGDLELSRQRKFNRQPVRVIELSDKADEQIRRDIFERINTGSDELRDMEKRKGIFTGPFYEFIRQRAADPLFQKVCPISHVRQRREEAEELVLRYFAYSDTYLEFQHDVRKFLDKFLKENQQEFDLDRRLYEFDAMIKFANAYLPTGFKKTANATSVPRVRFEALSCGITLALRVQPNLVPEKKGIQEWINSAEFSALVVSDASNSRPRLKGRIEYVRDRLLGV